MKLEFARAALAADEGKAEEVTFTQALAALGWTDGRNVRMDLRWYGDDINRIPMLARELARIIHDSTSFFISPRCTRAIYLS